MRCVLRLSRLFRATKEHSSRARARLCVLLVILNHAKRVPTCDEENKCESSQRGGGDKKSYCRRKGFLPTKKKKVHTAVLAVPRTGMHKKHEKNKKRPVTILHTAAPGTLLHKMRASNDSMVLAARTVMVSASRKAVQVGRKGSASSPSLAEAETLLWYEYHCTKNGTRWFTD